MMEISQKSRQSGFTVIELIVVAAVLIAASILIFIQLNNLKIANQDAQRKTAINAMHYALEEVYYKNHQSYPASLTASTLPSVDPALFTDPDGFTLGKDTLSEEELNKLANDGEADESVQQRINSIAAGKSINYHYEPTGCDTSGKCKSYKLRAELVSEAEYVKKNRSH